MASGGVAGGGHATAEDEYDEEKEGGRGGRVEGAGWVVSWREGGVGGGGTVKERFVRLLNL